MVALHYDGIKSWWQYIVMTIYVINKVSVYIGRNLGIPQIQDVILAAILDLASRWSPNIILTPETDFSP